ncbi:MFS transporter [Photobacterium nomapromontoriensis]|uniref:MFS transporter n=1 Tax=Photobacterium nomapromontoriensis TaxID=2910237 RepID=UPI003D0B30A8
MLTKLISPMSRFLPLVVLLICNVIAHSLFMISFPVAGRELGMTDIQTGALLSLSAFTMMLAAPWWGKRIDRQGHRSAIFSGILITAFFLLLTGTFIALQPTLLWSTTTLFTVLLSLRIIQSLGVAGLMPSAQAYIAVLTPADRRVSGMGILGATFGFGSLIGGSLAMAGGTTFFPLSVVFLGGLMVILCVRLPLDSILISTTKPTALAPHKPSHKNPLSTSLPIKRIWPYLLITFCVLLSYGLLQQTAAIRLQDQFNYLPQDALKGGGALLTATMVCMAAGQALLSYFSVKHPMRWLFLGLIGGMIGLMGLAIASSFLAMIIAMTIIGFSMSLIFPSNLALISLSADSNNQAYVASLNTVGKGLGLAAGPLLGASLHHINPTLPVWAALLLLALLTIIVIYSTISNRHSELMASS